MILYRFKEVLLSDYGVGGSIGAMYVARYLQSIDEIEVMRFVDFDEHLDYFMVAIGIVSNFI